MASSQPNILFIFTDQQRLSTLGWYEDAPWNGLCKTPTLDRLREQSVLFTNAYTPCPLCSPARASVMTGVYPIGHGVTDNVDTFNSNVMELPDCEHLLSRRLESAGYRCGYSGKWHPTSALSTGSAPGRCRALGFWSTTRLRRRYPTTWRKTPYL